MTTASGTSNTGAANATPDQHLGANTMFNLLRHYAIASFIGVLVTAAFLAGFYRHIEIREASDFARKSNLALAEAVLDSIRPDLVEYLGPVARTNPDEILPPPLPSPLPSVVSGLMEKTSIAKIRIYNSRGVVVFSSYGQEVGNVDSTNSGFAAASKGEAVSDVTYRDAFNSFGRQPDEANLVRTFIPVRLNPGQAIRGVLVTYVDLGPVVAQNQREVLIVMAGIGFILMLLYSALLLVVMRAKKVIEAQQMTIRERSEDLETLSIRLLAGTEAEKLKLALNLHDGLAQSLTAIKSRIEHGLERIPAEAAGNESINTALSALQGTIEEVQEMATELRPSSLDELGLLPTIRWLCREFQYLHPDIRIEQQISVQEQEIPEALKIVIYRIIEAVLHDIGDDPHRDQIRLSLQPNANAIILAIDDVPQELPSVKTVPNPRMRFSAAQERATLSGGAFSAAFNREGGITLHASWAM